MEQPQTMKQLLARLEKNMAEVERDFKLARKMIEEPITEELKTEDSKEGERYSQRLHKIIVRIEELSEGIYSAFE